MYLSYEYQKLFIILHPFDIKGSQIHFCFFCQLWSSPHRFKTNEGCTIFNDTYRNKQTST